LLQRERLGSTGVGAGIAIPHCRLAKAQAIFGLFARLARPIDFQAFDNVPVDLICLLIAPESAGADHLKALACTARMLREPKIAGRLRAARDVAALHALLAGEPASHAA
jgi:PTS system nitrogen regulatory IIA component